MLRHVRHHEVYWFCRTCWQEMPLFEEPKLHQVPLALEPYFGPKRRRSLVAL
ncbi:hypothetical protein H6G89_20890 [Oscillatoria sp. FACHB-1407]|uniref:hypothetical protein n=1 Tax=Oscillatoria sp. FACHB-1407 TaxID=2692847 RepID=UPI001688E9FB|nr:hypothetical protein [Oscillatoria sp. FACHB-1407]MBD2463464.1 hypothetical protein [Oscillatoria sp. FACHB-1407]